MGKRRDHTLDEPLHRYPNQEAAMPRNLLVLSALTLLLSACTGEMWKQTVRNALEQKVCRERAANDGDRARCVHPPTPRTQEGNPF